jgi:hypothetical protein
MVFKDGNKVGYAEGVGAGNLHVSESSQLYASVNLTTINYRS